MHSALLLSHSSQLCIMMMANARSFCVAIFLCRWMCFIFVKYKENLLCPAKKLKHFQVRESRYYYFSVLKTWQNIHLSRRAHFLSCYLLSSLLLLWHCFKTLWGMSFYEQTAHKWSISYTFGEMVFVFYIFIYGCLRCNWKPSTLFSFNEQQAAQFGVIVFVCMC